MVVMGFLLAVCIFFALMALGAAIRNASSETEVGVYSFFCGFCCFWAGLIVMGIIWHYWG